MKPARTCRHKNASNLRRFTVTSEHIATGYYAPYVKPGHVLWRFAGTRDPDARWCCDCREWLPLGPANDADPAVALEVRAAEIAVNGLDETPWFWATTDEKHGWRDHSEPGGDCHCSVAVRHDEKNWHAGYLARCIHDHDATGREG